MIFLGLLFLSVLYFPFFLSVAGDAQVHLVIAENFLNGNPFIYNISNDIPVVASTSPFWTIMLIVKFFIAGHLAPILLKISSLALFLGTSYSLFRAAKNFFKLSKISLWSLIIIWSTSSSIIANALSGLENILSAYQLLLIFIVSGYYLRGDQIWLRSLQMGGLLGWAILTRPEGGALCLLVVLLCLTIKLLSPIERKKISNIISSAFIIIVLAIIILFPWYCYQYNITGKFLSDSSLARMYSGRRNCFEIIHGLVYLHPKTFFTLGTVFAPLSFGCFVFVGNLIFRMLQSSQKQIDEMTIKYYPQIVTISVLLCSIFFYTFIVGADHFGRYFLIGFPFFFLAGFSGLQKVYESWERYKYLTRIIFFIVIGFLLMGSSLDYHRRLVEKHSSLFNLHTVVNAPLKRSAYTDKFLDKLGVLKDKTIKIAATEVQLKYYVDERVTVLSLDGRSDHNILKYMDPNTGIPDFGSYFKKNRPNFVQLGQWHQGQGWTELIFPWHIKKNLVGDWEKRVKDMNIGESFKWEGYNVKYVTQNIVKIDWNQGLLTQTTPHH